jgi:dUTP pyrophosphatase
LGRVVIKIKIKKFKDTAQIPFFQTKGSSGADLHAAIDSPMEIKPMQRALIPSGIGLEIPEGYEIQVRARSGLAYKKGLSLVNGLGTIDADYRGEISVIAINLGDETITIEPDERIAQIICIKTEQFEFEETTDLSASDRGDKGFGSTGSQKV